MFTQLKWQIANGIALYLAQLRSLKIQGQQVYQRVNTYLLTGLLLLLPYLGRSQGQQTKAALTGVMAWLNTFLPIVFSIIMLIGIIKTIKAFMEGQQGQPWKHLAMVVVAGILWYASGALIGDLGTSIGTNNIYTGN